MIHMTDILITKDGKTIKRARAGNSLRAITDYTATAGKRYGVGEFIKTVLVAHQMADTDDCKQGGAQACVIWANGAQCQTTFLSYSDACDWFKKRALYWGLTWNHDSTGYVLWMEAAANQGHGVDVTRPRF